MRRKIKKEQLDGLHFRSNQPFRLANVQSWKTGPKCEVSSCQKWNSDFSILSLSCVDGHWEMNVFRAVLAPCLPVQLPPSGRRLCAQKVTAQERKQHKHQAQINFCQAVFIWIFKLSKNRQELFHYSTAELCSIWETHLFFLKYHHITPLCNLCLGVCACIWASKCVSGWRTGRVFKEKVALT